MGQKERRRRRLKWDLFVRDGWKEGNTWYAMCSFGCGEILVYKTATMDHYPIMKQHGGRLTLGNLRLACQPCNTANCNHKEFVSKRQRQRARRNMRKRSALAAMVYEGKSNHAGIIRMDFK